MTLSSWTSLKCRLNIYEQRDHDFQIKRMTAFEIMRIFISMDMAKKILITKITLSWSISLKVLLCCIFSHASQTLGHNFEYRFS